MEASTTIRKMMAGNKIVVPSYQRAYSWDTPKEKTGKKTQTDVFLSDLEEYKQSNVKSSYYFGHFLFEEKIEERKQIFCVIDGQQRITTIVICLVALFDSLKAIRSLDLEEKFFYEDVVKREHRIGFSTVEYDNQLFIDYVIEQTKVDHNNLETESEHRIVIAFDFFREKFSSKSEDYLTKMLSIIGEANCTTHLVQNESEAIQMFIFQNNRGKQPSNLEIVKAKFMYSIHLHGSGDKDQLIKEIKKRFEKVYKSISSIEYRVSEDDILLYTLRVYFNSLKETSSLVKIDKELSKDNPIDFIKKFTQYLSRSFEHLSTFFKEDEQKSLAIHSLVTLSGIAIAFPFIIKAYRYGLDLDKRERLCASLEKLVLRHRLIGTRADIVPRINDVFENFTETNNDIQPIIHKIEEMKIATHWWWAYWNNEKLNESLQGGVNHEIARYLLWKYENYLINRGKSGYDLSIRFNQIEKPELEHIAPTTEPKQEPHGYDKYDEDFYNQYLNCLGNYLLLSKSHNASIHNDPFLTKLKDYKYLKQQREIQDLVGYRNPNQEGENQNLVTDPQKLIWSRELIKTRKDKIVRFVVDNC